MCNFLTYSTPKLYYYEIEYNFSQNTCSENNDLFLWLFLLLCFINQDGGGLISFYISKIENISTLYCGTQGLQRLRQKEATRQEIWFYMRDFIFKKQKYAHICIYYKIVQLCVCCVMLLFFSLSSNVFSFISTIFVSILIILQNFIAKIQCMMPARQIYTLITTTTTKLQRFSLNVSSLLFLSFFFSLAFSPKRNKKAANILVAVVRSNYA